MQYNVKTRGEISNNLYALLSIREQTPWGKDTPRSDGGRRNAKTVDIIVESIAFGLTEIDNITQDVVSV